MTPARTAMLSALLAAGACTDPPAPGPGPMPDEGDSAALEAGVRTPSLSFAGGNPPVLPGAAAPRPAADAGTPPPPPPPAPLPARDPAVLAVELRAGGPRRTCLLGTARGRLAGEGGGFAPGEPGKVASRVEGLPGGGLRVDGAAVAARALLLVPAPGTPFTLDGVPYPGRLRVAAGADGTLRFSNEAPLEDYLCGVLAGELFPDSPPEALRALAVLARSFALSHLADLSDDPGLHQAYRGMPSAAVLPVLRAAVASTAGVRLVDPAGGPLPNYWYHSTCGGHTADASVVFGVPPSALYAGVPCSKCSSSKYWQWETVVPEKDLRRALRFGSAVARIEIGSRSIDGRVLAFRATAAGGTVKYVPALQVRQALGANRLRSTLVTSVEPAGAGADLSFRFAGRGWGHGVGLCQVGACALAAEGWNAERILAYYYPGSRIVRAAR